MIPVKVTVYRITMSLLDKVMQFYATFSCVFSKDVNSKNKNEIYTEKLTEKSIFKVPSIFVHLSSKQRYTSLHLAFMR